MRRKVLLIATVLVAFSSAVLFAQDNSQGTAAQSSGIRYVAAALAVGIACIGGGLAVGKIGAAAMGAMAENADLSGKALPFVGLAEGICLWGFLVGLLIIIM